MSVKPFSEHGHYTSVHDAVFDVVMPRCPPNAFKVLLFVLRKTRGWKKEEDVLRYAEIKAGTGIKSDTTLAKELDWLLKKKLLNAVAKDGSPHEKGGRKAPAYSLNRDFELRITPETETSRVSTTPENEVTATPETGAFNNQSSNNHSRRGAEAPNPMENLFTYYCHLANAMGLDIFPEDREQTAGNFAALLRKHEPDRETRIRVVSKMLEARTAGVSLSPQKAYEKIMFGNVHQLRTNPEQARPKKRVL